MKKFELTIFMDGYPKYDVYVGGTFAVICNGVNITRHDDSKLISIVGDHYFSVFENWLRAIPKMLTSTDEIICAVLDDPYNFVFRRKNDEVEVRLYHRASSPEAEKKMGGRGKPIAVPLEDFVTEVLDKTDYFINVMREKNPNIVNEPEFQNIVKRKKEGEKAWSDYLRK